MGSKLCNCFTVLQRAGTQNRENVSILWTQHGPF